MAILGRKEGGYYVTADGEGNKIEGETRQCIHCQFVWEYGPNRPDALHAKKTTRGFCYKHQGFICCRTECVNLFGLAPDCDTFEEQQKRLKEKLQKNVSVPELGLMQGDYEVTQSGILLKK